MENTEKINWKQIEAIKEVAPLEIALLINENEDLIRVNATCYPLKVRIKDHPIFVKYDLQEKYPYVPFQQDFASEMYLTATDSVYLVDPLALYMTKASLVCQWSPDSHTKVPIRKLHNRRIFA